MRFREDNASGRRHPYDSDSDSARSSEPDGRPVERPAGQRLLSPEKLQEVVAEHQLDVFAHVGLGEGPASAGGVGVLPADRRLSPELIPQARGTGQQPGAASPLAPGSTRELSGRHRGLTLHMPVDPGRTGRRRNRRVRDRAPEPRTPSRAGSSSPRTRAPDARCRLLPPDRRLPLELKKGACATAGGAVV